MLSIGFSYVDGQETLDRFLSRRGELPYAYMLYSELGDLYVGKQRYTDAADTYRAFVDRYPDHERAPLLQMQAIEAYKKGGFAQLVLDGKKEFVERYRLGSSFWAARTPEQFPRGRPRAQDEPDGPRAVLPRRGAALEEEGGLPRGGTLVPRVPAVVPG